MEYIGFDFIYLPFCSAQLDKALHILDSKKAEYLEKWYSIYVGGLLLLNKRVLNKLNSYSRKLKSTLSDIQKDYNNNNLIVQVNITN